MQSRKHGSEIDSLEAYKPWETSLSARSIYERFNDTRETDEQNNEIRLDMARKPSYFSNLALAE